MLKLFFLVVGIFCAINIISVFVSGVRKLNFGKNMERKLLIYTIALLCAFSATMFSESVVAASAPLGTYLFTSDEHYFRYEIAEVNDVYKNMFSNRCFQEYHAKTGETIIVDEDSIEVIDKAGNAVYSNAGGKIIVVKE